MSADRRQNSAPWFGPEKRYPDAENPDGGTKMIGCCMLVLVLFIAALAAWLTVKAWFNMAF